MKVAQYEVLGIDAKREVRPARDDRNIGSWSSGDFAITSNHLSSLRDGRRLK